MVLRFIEGFEGANRADKYITGLSGAIPATFAGRVGGAAEAVAAAHTFQTDSFGSDQAEWFVGFGMYAESSTIATNSSVYFSLQSGANTKFTFELRWTGTRFEAYAIGGPIGTTTTQGLNTSGGSTFMTADSWYFFEVRVNLAGTTSNIEVRLDGAVTPIATFSLDFSPAPLTANTFLWHTEPGWHFDDMRVLDSSGASLNTWLGPQQVLGIEVEAVGNSDQWDNTGGALDKVVALTDASDSTYLLGDVQNEQQLVSIVDLPASVGTVYGIVLENTIRLGSLGTRDLQVVGRQGGTDYDWGSAATLFGTNTRTYTEILDTAPDGTAWSLTALNSIEYGLKVTD